MPISLRITPEKEQIISEEALKGGKTKTEYLLTMYGLPHVV